MFLLKYFVFSLTLLVKTMITSAQSSVLHINSIRNEGWNDVRNILALLNLQVPITIDSNGAHNLELSQYL